MYIKGYSRMREKILFDKEWMFHRGDLNQELPPIKRAAYVSAKTERCHVGPASPYYYVTDGQLFTSSQKEEKTEKWECVELPHDYLAGDEPDRNCNEALGFCRYDNAWYIKRFVIPVEDEGKRITLLFDGVATHATVYLNGCLMKHNFCGYTPFEVDITDMLKYGEENSLAVYVNVEQHEGWWYEGAGIYRHVWLIKTAPVALDLWGVWTRPEEQADSSWSVAVEAVVRNDTQKRQRVRIVGEILDTEGNTAATAEVSGAIEYRDKRTFRYKFALGKARLWSPDTPYQYTLKTKIYCGTDETDCTSVRFGCRTIRTDADEGLFINGKNYKIKGVCVHENCGLTGKAVPDNIQRYKVKLLKEMGANGYRTAHYPHSEAMMDALDENGFIVMDETRWFESTDEGKEQLSTLIRRDRNRPSVIFWSIGNEEPHHCTEQGVRVCRALTSLAHKLDPTRPVLTAITHKNAVCFNETDVIGINYLWKHIDDIRANNPRKPFVSSECAATGTTRGWYLDDDALHGYISGYDHTVNSTFISREDTWKRLTSYPYMMGGYQWSGFEYRGEASWPRLASQSGAIDLFMQKKDAFYQNLSHWSEAPMIHLLPHWNHRGREGEPIRVVAYTNQPEAELFLNGKSLGKRQIEKYGHAEWQVPYAVGKLEVRAYSNGNETAYDLKQTTGSGVSLKLSLDTADVKGGDVAILTCLVTDAEGMEVPDACPTVSFTANGAGRLYSTGSSVSDHTTIFCPTRKMYMGRIGLAVKLSELGGACNVYAFSDGLASASLTLEAEPLKVQKQ